MLRGGVRPAWLVHCSELLQLRGVDGGAGNGPDDAYQRAIALESLVRVAITQLGDGPYGVAAALLFGTHPHSRGRLLKDRRRLAADELGILPSTFRKNYEDAMLDDVAVEIWKLLP